MGKIILIHLISYTKAEEELGPIFILANNAGYSRAAKFEDTPIEEIKVFLVTQHLRKIYRQYHINVLEDDGC